MDQNCSRRCSKILPCLMIQKKKKRDLSHFSIVWICVQFTIRRRLVPYPVQPPLIIWGHTISCAHKNSTRIHVYAYIYRIYGVDKLTRLHLSTFDCPPKLLSLSLEEERGGRTLQVKICSANEFNQRFSHGDFQQDPLSMDHFIGFFEAIFPSVKWITNCSLYIHSN